MNKNIKNTITSQVNDLNIKSLKKSFNVEAAITGLFVLVAAILSAFVASGFKFTWEVFYDEKFYIQTAINFLIMMFSYSFVKTIVIRREKATNPKYTEVKGKEYEFVKFVRDNFLEEVIAEKVAIANEERRLQAANNILARITYGLYAQDLENFKDPNNISVNDDAFNDFCLKHGLITYKKDKSTGKVKAVVNQKQAKRLREVIVKVLKGEYKYQPIYTKEILTTTDADHRHILDLYSFDERKADIKEATRKGVLWLVASALTSSIYWGGWNASFWLMLLTNATLILSSAITAIMAAHQRIKVLTLVSENKTGFLNQATKDYRLELKNGKEKVKEIVKEETNTQEKVAYSKEEEKVIQVSTIPKELPNIEYETTSTSTL